MSYNDGYFGETVTNFLTDADQAALKEIWGENGTGNDQKIDPTALNESLIASSLLDSSADKKKNAWRKDGINIFLDTLGSSTSYFDGEYIEDALPFSSEEQSIATSIIKELDQLLDVEFVLVNNHLSADIAIMIHDRSAKTGSEGFSCNWEWDEPWYTTDEADRKHYKFKYGDISIGDDQSLAYFEYLVRHRLGYALGLQQPDNTPLLQSIMGDGEYNHTSPYGYTNLDKSALQSIWGVEDGELGMNNLPAHNGSRIVLDDGHQDREYELKVEDLVGEYTDADGDILWPESMAVNSGSIAKHASKDVYTFTPELGFSGRVNVTYSIGDGFGGAVAANQIFDINPYDGIIYGGLGKNKLMGTFGADNYLIKGFEKFTNKTADVILDFNSSEGDVISISQERIPEFTDSEHTFKSVRGKKKIKKIARTETDFIYDARKGTLFFNSNGNGRGFGSKSSGGALLVLSGRPQIESSDIVLVD